MNVQAIYGDYHHAAAPYARALKKAIGGRKANVDAACYPTAFDPGVLDGRDLLVLCKEGVVPGSKDLGDRWMDRAGEEAVERFVAAGGTLLAWHSGLAGYDPEGPLHEMYGGHFRGHPPKHEFTLEPTGDGESPCAGVEPWAVSDELYRFTVRSDNADIWLVGRSAEHGEQPVGWTRAHGRGKVFCFTLAHELSNLLHPHTQAILSAILDRAAE